MTHNKEVQLYQILERHGIIGESAVELVSDIIDNEQTTIQQVKCFHETFDHPIGATPQIPDVERIRLRLDLIGEELVELAQATDSETEMIHTIRNMLNLIVAKDRDYVGYAYAVIEVWLKKMSITDWTSLPHKKARATKEKIVAALDALCDLRYVSDGTIIEYGLAEVFEEAFQEVQRSNMSKTCETREVAELTCGKYTIEGIDAEIIENGKLFLVRNKENHKILKSVLYSPANLENFITK